MVRKTLFVFSNTNTSAPPIPSRDPPQRSQDHNDGDDVMPEGGIGSSTHSSQHKPPGLSVDRKRDREADPMGNIFTASSDVGGVIAVTYDRAAPSHHHTSSTMASVPLDTSQHICATFPADTPLLIVAGAGSGKTQTIANRAAFLIQSGVAPHNILGLSYSRDSAEELRRRTAAVLPPSSRRSAAFLKLKTIHAFCLEMLRQYHEKGQTIRVADSKKVKEIASRAIFASRADARLFPGDDAARAPRLASSDETQQLLKAVDRQKHKLPAEGLPIDGLAWHSVRDPYHRDNILFEYYQRELHEVEAMVDFADLQLYFLDLLRRKEPSPKGSLAPDGAQRRTVLEEVRRRFTHIIVDEAQDIDEIQYEILYRMAGHECRVSCVGDPFQSIYGFRGAMKDFFAQFRSRFEKTAERKLEVNYRSSTEIVAASNSVIRDAERCRSHKGPNGNIVNIVYTKSGRDVALQRGLVQAIEHLRNTDKTLRYGEIGVLVRIGKKMKIASEGLAEAKLPYRMLHRRDPSAAEVMNGIVQTVLTVLHPEGSHLCAIQSLEAFMNSCQLKGGGGLVSGLRAAFAEQRNQPDPSCYYDMLAAIVDSGFTTPIYRKCSIRSEKRVKNALSQWLYMIRAAHEKLTTESRRIAEQYTLVKTECTDIKLEADDDGEVGSALLVQRIKSLRLALLQRSMAVARTVLSDVLHNGEFLSEGEKEGRRKQAIAEVRREGEVLDALAGSDEDDGDGVDTMITDGSTAQMALLELLDDIELSLLHEEEVLMAKLEESLVCSSLTQSQRNDSAMLFALQSELPGSSDNIRQPAEILSAALDEIVSLGAPHNNAGESLLSKVKGLRSNKDAITISTVHKAKGLEWRAVVIFDCSDGHFPLVSQYNGGKPTIEELHIFYVAMSRAMEQLVLVAGEEPSRYLKEIPAHLLRAL